MKGRIPMLSAFGKRCKRLHVNVFPVVRFTCKRLQTCSAYRKSFALERAQILTES